MNCYNCGKNMSDESIYCSNCGKNLIKKDEIVINNVLKAIIVAIICVIPFMGAVAGFISGIIFMNNESNDLKSFGKAILVLSIIVFILQVLFIVFVSLISKLFFNLLFSTLYSFIFERLMEFISIDWF